MTWDSGRVIRPCALLILSAVLFSMTTGCATVMHRTTQKVEINSKPSGATVTDMGNIIGFTPMVAKLKRKDKHDIRFYLDGHETYETQTERKLSAWLLGNAVFIYGAPVGLLIDAMSGGAHKIKPKRIHALLRPSAPGRTARRTPSPQPKPAQQRLSTPSTDAVLSRMKKPPAAHKPPVTAVWQPTAYAGVSKEWMPPIAETLRATLLKSKWFRLVAREDMEKILAEHNIRISDACDTTECAVENGQILGAEKIVVGTASKVGATYQVVLKLIDVSSSEIENVGQAQSRGDVDILIPLVKHAAVQLFQ